MQVKSVKLNGTKYKLSVTADQKFIDDVKNQTLRHFGSRHTNVPGFRAGKAPLALIEKQVDPTQLQQEFLEEAINRLYFKAVQTENLRPIAQPQVTLKKFVPFSQLEFDAEIEAIGEVKIANYKSIKLPKTKVTIEANDINGVIENLRLRLSERVLVDRPSKNGDEVDINFKGTGSNNQPISGADGTNYPIVLGSNSFIPGFEPSLVGLKTEDEKTFDLIFPKDYEVKNLQSKKVTFWVKINKVNELNTPAVDDKFAAKAGPFKTVAELKADIKKQLLNERQQEQDRAYENQLIGAIAEKSSVKVPDILIDDQVERAEQQERQNLAYRGQTWEEHLSAEGLTEEEHRKRNRPDAEKSVKAGLVLSEIAQQEGITVTPEELEIRKQLLKGQYKDPQMQGELDKPENMRDLENQLITEKTIAKIVQYTAK